MLEACLYDKISQNSIETEVLQRLEFTYLLLSAAVEEPDDGRKWAVSLCRRELADDILLVSLLISQFPDMYSYPLFRYPGSSF